MVKPRVCSIGRLPGAAIVAGVVLAALAVPAAAFAAPTPAGQPDVATSITADKASYTVGEPITVTYTVTNVGSAPATNVQGIGGDAEGIDFTDGTGYDPVDLAPGQSWSHQAKGIINEYGGNQGYAIVIFDFGGDNGDANPDNNRGTLRVEVRSTTTTPAGSPSATRTAAPTPSSTPALPVTGARVGPIGLAAVILLSLGAGIILMSRRRRVRFVSTED